MVVNRLSHQERKQEIIRLIKELGLDNLHLVTLAEKFGVTRQQIYKDIQKILNAWKPDDPNRIYTKIDTFYEKGLKTCHKQMNNENPSIALKAAVVGDDISEGYVKFLESVGRKQKVADKIEHQGDIQFIVPEWMVECQKIVSKDISQQKNKKLFTEVKQNSDSSVLELDSESQPVE